jgi:hypothetical protein
MKPVPILVLTAAAVAAVALHQQRRLTGLREEARRLENQASTSSSTGSRRAPVEPPKEARPGQVEFARESMVETLLALQVRNGGSNPEQAERLKRLLLAAKDLTARDMEAVMAALLSDARLAAVERDQILLICHQLFGGAAPFSWREYLAAHRELPDWQRHFDDVCRICLKEDGKRALALIEEETTRGNPEVATTGIRTSVLLELAASDPDKMLARAVSPELAADPDALAHLGGYVDDQFKEPADHRRFLAALRRAQEKNPSPVLAKIREDYTREMAGQLAGWPAAEAIALLESEFTADERFLVAYQSASRVDLSGPEPWVDWFLKIDPAEWSAWNTRRETFSKHPLVRQIEGRARKDAELPATWLAKIPPGALRDDATLSYAWMIADRDPERAAGYLGELPDSKGKQNLVKKIGKARR